MPAPAVTDAHHHLAQAAHALDTASGPRAADADLLAVLTLTAGGVRALERAAVAAAGQLLRRGVFTERGYRSPVTAVADLLGCDRADARRLVLVAEHVTPQTTLDGQALPPTLPATATVFAGGQVGTRHVEIIARVLTTPAAARLAPGVWAGAEQALAGHAPTCAPTELLTWGTALIDALDADGPEPDDDTHRPVVNELHLRRHRDRPGGTLTGRFDDAAMFDAITTVLGTGSRPTDSADERTPAQRHAAALADACGHVLDHGALPEVGGERPHLTVTVRLEDLQARARGAVLDLGGPISPSALRQLACDARVLPVVLGGDGQPVDIGRDRRTVPRHLRRAVAARDGGCARLRTAAQLGWGSFSNIAVWPSTRPLAAQTPRRHPAVPLR